MLRRDLLLLLALIGTAAPSALAAGPPSAAAVVEWSLSSWPPYVSNEPGTDGGPFRAMVQAIAADLPEYEHVVTIEPLSRTNARLENGERLCTVGKIATPKRAERLTFSRIILHFLPNRLITTAATADSLGLRAGVAVDVAALLAEGQITLALREQRSFGPLDPALAKREGSAVQRVYREADGFRLILAGRVDATIAQPPEVSYFIRANPHGADALRAFPIAGIGPIEAPLAGCTRGDWGAAMIAHIDAAASTEVFAAFVQPYERLLDQTATAEYRALLTKTGLMVNGQLRDPRRR